MLSLAILFFNSFDEVITHWRHVREFAADRIGGQVAGARSRASALIRSGLSYPVIFSVLDKVWHNPDRDRGSLLEEMTEAARQNGFDDPAEHLEESQQHPTDTHPTTRERVEALGLSCRDAELLADASRPPDESSVETYLPQADAICARLAEGFRREASEYQSALDVSLAERLALARDEPFVLYGTRGAGCLSALSLFPAVIAVGFAILMFALQAGDDFVAVGFISLGIALFFGVPPLLWERKKKRGPMPVLAFTDTGIASRAFTGELPWVDVDDYQIVVQENNGSCTIHLSLNKPPPEYRKARFKFVWAYYDADTRTFSLHLDDTKDQGGKKVDPQIVSKELHARLNSGIARVIMEERDRMREED